MGYSPIGHSLLRITSKTRVLNEEVHRQNHFHPEVLLFRAFVRSCIETINYICVLEFVRNISRLSLVSIERANFQ